jgi:hypothetical protein
MTLIIELTPDEETRLQAVASAKGVDPVGVVRQWIGGLPADPMPTHPVTPSEALAYWKREGITGCYGDPDIPVAELARRLRNMAETRVRE